MRPCWFFDYVREVDGMRIVIRAGGVGTRLWPWSRSDRPKQFLQLFGGESAVQVACNRFISSGLVDPGEVYVSVGKESLDLALEQLPQIRRQQIIIEPMLRDTAAAVGLEAVWVVAHGGPGIVASLGSDHCVSKPAEFVKALRAAEMFLTENPSYLVTIACAPTRVETNYGHVRMGEALGEYDGVSVHCVSGFTEKPDSRIAKQYMESGDYLWNANFFVWHTDTLLAQFREFEPEMYRMLIEMQDAARDLGFRDALRTIYPKLKKTAIDYAVLEPAARAGRMAVVPVDMGWSDIGSWATLTDAFEPDADGNLCMGPVLTDSVKDCTIVSRNSARKIVAAIGVEGLVIVDTPDAILICPKDKCARVKRLVEKMRLSDDWKGLV